MIRPSSRKYQGIGVGNSVPGSAGGSTSGSSPTISDFEALEKLASLHDRGILTDEEFEAKKKEILDL